MSRTFSRATVLCLVNAVFAIGCSSSDPVSPATAGTSGQSATAGSGGSGGAGVGGGAPIGGSGVSGGAAGSTGGGAGASAGNGSGGGGTSGGGASSGAGGVGGSAGSGGGGGASGKGCAKKAYQLCEDFEGAAPGVGDSMWAIRNNSTLDVVTDEVHSGTHAVRVKVGAIEEKKALPGKDYWMRVYVRLDEPNTEHEGFIVVNGQPESYRLLNNPGGKGGIMLDRTSNDQGWRISNTVVLPKLTWNCYEWHETATQIHTYLDGKEVTDVVADWPALQTISSLSFGFERYHGGNTGYIWYDDIVVDTERVGCDAP